MIETRKILKSLIFLSLTVVVVYLSISLSGYDDASIELIELDGCYHLSEDQYFKSSNLDKKEDYSQLTLRVIKDRIEKHPYVRSADVRFEGHGTVMVSITEKEFEAIVIIDDQQFLLTEHMQIVPVMLYTRGLDYPIIRKAELDNNLTPMEFIDSKSHKDIITACKIISTIKLTNSELFEVLSEIDINEDQGMKAYFSTMNYELRIGNEDVISRTICFNTWWERMKNQGLEESLDYVDLRFDNHIFIGYPIDGTEFRDGQI